MEWSTIIYTILGLIIAWLSGKHYFIRKTIVLNEKKKEKIEQTIKDLQNAIQDNKLTPTEITQILDDINRIIGVKNISEFDKIVGLLEKIEGGV